MAKMADHAGQQDGISVWLVVYDRNGVAGAWLDEKRAHQFAKATKSVVVKLPISADYREAADGQG